MKNTIIKKPESKRVSLCLGVIPWVATLLVAAISPIDAAPIGSAGNLSERLAPAEKVISGRVLAEDTKDGLPGATVSLKGVPGVGTMTDVQGNFKLTIPGNKGTLIFSFVGYRSKEISIGDKSAVEVTLETDVYSLSEVVVTGYGSQKRENLTGSVATISSKKLMDVTTPNVANMIQGKIPGVEVTSNTGQPGGLPTIRIRGRASIVSSTDPIWVVDGVIWHGVPNLNPGDIESMTVLKDAAAGALYGSRGANGVLVVTTKGGKFGKKNQYWFKAETGISQFNNGNFKLMDSQQLYDYWGGFYAADGKNKANLPEYYKPALLQTNTDWLKLGTQNGKIQQYTLAFQGGGEKSTIYASGNYYKEEGSVKGYNYERFSTRVNMDYELSPRVIFKPKVAATYTQTEDRQHSLYNMYLNLPWDKPYDANGIPRNAQIASPWYGRDQSNYLYDLQWNYGTSKTFNVIANMDLQWNITDKLVFRSTNNTTYYNSDGFSYTDPRSNAGLDANGQLSESMAKRTTRFTNQMLNYTNTFGKHFIDALAAYEYNDYTYNDLTATGKGISPGSTVLNTVATPVSTKGITNDYSFQSVLFNANYSYNDRFNAQISFRRDGSSRFGKNNRYGNFYSVSAGWNIHKEAFFRSRIIDYLRVKAAHGGVGNTPVALYPQYGVYAIDQQYNGSPAAIISTLGNDNLTWEKSFDTNLGVQIGLWKHVNFGVEIYNKNTSGLLHYVPFPTVSGYTGRYENIGAVRNQGIEMALGVDIIKHKDFTWHADLTFSRNLNKIIELYQNQRQINGQKVIEVGENIDTWYLRKWMGVDPANGKPLWERVDPSTGARTTTSTYSQATLQETGVSTPDFYGGLQSEVAYKGLSLSVNFGYSKGAMAYNATRQLFDSDGAYPTYNQMVLADGWSRWTPENPNNATHPQAIYGGNSQSNRPSSRYLEDASYIRLRNITLAYRLPKNLCNYLRMSGVGLNVSVDNLATWTKYSGVDPEAAIYGVNGDLTSVYPVSRRVMFGLNVTF